MINYIAIVIATASLIANPSISAININYPIDQAWTNNATSLLAQNPVHFDAQRRVKSPVQRVMKLWVTAYTSRVEETDDTPFITASGSYVRDGVIASNSLPIGTLVRIPDHFGNKTFRVEDRMNTRYTDNIDIWFSDLNEARIFGKKHAIVEIL